MSNDEISAMKPFFSPQSVVLIGATKKFRFGLGQTMTLLSQGFGDRLFFVNPSEEEIFGKKVHKEMREIPDGVDLAILVIPARFCPGALAECAGKGVKAAIVLAAGFSETGPEGRRLEEEMGRIARESRMRVIGPNCMGVVNTENGFAVSELLEDASRPGHIGVVAQSGVFGNILLDWAPEQGVRFSKVITIGNRCDVDEAAVVRYLAMDEQTRVIAVYLEGFKDANRAMEAFREASLRKPVLVLKSGRTEPGKSATLSHTGSISGEDHIYQGAFRQCGIVRAADVYELFDMARAFATQPLPAGKRIAVVTTSGSLGAMTADACSDLGLEMATLSRETLERISTLAPPWMNVGNPLDLGPSGLLFDALEVVARDSGVDGIIAISVIPFQVVHEITKKGTEPELFFHPYRKISGYAGQKPILFSTMGNRAYRDWLREALGDPLPLLSRPENAAKAMWALYRYASRRSS